MKEKIVGIMGAMPEEIDAVISLLQECTCVETGMRSYYSGYINGVKAVVVFSRWGKVAAAATAATLVQKFSITHLIFTGVAGAISRNLRIGDIVIAKRLIQHDMDARPLMPRYEIPLLQKTYFECDGTMLSLAVNAANSVLKNSELQQLVGSEALQDFGITMPAVQLGDIASGDQFFSASEAKNLLMANLPAVLCVEMEGAAAAQVCFENSVPFIIIRTISDAANEQSPDDFASFIKNIAGKYAVAVIRNMFYNI